MLLSSCEHFHKNLKYDNCQSDSMVQDTSKEVAKELHENGNSSDRSKDKSMIKTIEPGNIEGKSSDKSQENDKCFLCLNDANEYCVKCSLPYCCDAHYKLHSTSNKDIVKGADESSYCFPFRVLERPEVGRYVVATRDIEPLEPILIDYPAAFGPNHDTSPACLECLLPVNEENVYLCDLCGLPLCSPTTACGIKRSNEEGQHAKGECKVFSKPTPTGFKFTVKLDREIPEGRTKFIAPEYGCITPLRLLLLKETEPHTWERMKLLMDHDEDRRKETEYQKMFQRNVVDFLRKKCGFDYSEEEIFRVIGILRTNAFHIQDPIMKMYNVGGRAIYPTFSFLSHSCLSNSRYVVDPTDHKMVLRAQTSIKKGDEITVQYLSFMYGQCRRKKEIPSFWFFDCRCKRCLDPTDCGSLVSAMICDKCESEKTDKDNKQGCTDGYLLPDDPTNVIKGTWSCKKCGFSQDGKRVDDICENAAYELTTASNDGSNIKMMSTYNTLLQKFSKVLHPNHYIIMTVKKYIADSLGTVQGFLFPQLSEEQIDLKIQYSTEFLNVIGLVDPGITEWRGLMLFELHTALYWKANKKYAASQGIKPQFEAEHENSSATESGSQSNSNQLLCYSTSCRNNVNYACYSIHCSKKNVRNGKQVRTVEEKNLSPKEVFLQELKKCQEILKESMTCLQYQAENTKEGFTYKKAKKASNDISDLVFFFDYL